MIGKMREEFEAYWRDRECFSAEQAAKYLTKEVCGGYTYRDPNEAWKVWQASRAAIRVDLPHLFPFYLDTVTEALLAHGIKVNQWSSK